MRAVYTQQLEGHVCPSICGVAQGCQEHFKDVAARVLFCTEPFSICKKISHSIPVGTGAAVFSGGVVDPYQYSTHKI